jgi:hypothetical protein
LTTWIVTAAAFRLLTSLRTNPPDQPFDQRDDTPMLTIATDVLPRTGLAYVAFRLAFCGTWERLTLLTQVGESARLPAHIAFGYLTEVPFLRHVPPLRQLDLLAQTWARHRADDPVEATLVDESVIYASCETAARMVEAEPEAARTFLLSGPEAVAQPVNRRLATELRTLHLGLPNDGDFLMISQFEDIPPDEARALKREFGLDEARLESMFEALAHWHPSAVFKASVAGLLSDAEVDRLGTDYHLW